MNEGLANYVVKWRHLRYPKQVDEWYTEWTRSGISSGYTNVLVGRCDLFDQHLYRGLHAYTPYSGDEGDVWPSGHGGKTECRIYQVIESPSGKSPSVLMEVAYAVSVCSWRDQFSRRAGRLYSLALALCELDADAKVKWDLFMQCGTHPMPYWACEFLAVEWRTHDIPAIKRACSEIVAAWKHPKRTNREQVQALYREAMSLCDTTEPNPLDADTITQVVNALQCTQAMWDRLYEHILNRDKRAAAGVCAEIVQGASRG